MADKINVEITIPDDLAFSDLDLQRDKEGMITFKMDPIHRICEASGIDITMFTETHEDNLSGLIVEWYGHHRKNGGVPDVTAEQMIQEIIAEDYTKAEGMN